MPKIETPTQGDPLECKDFFCIPIEFFFNEDPRSFFDTTITELRSSSSTESCVDLGVD